MQSVKASLCPKEDTMKKRFVVMLSALVCLLAACASEPTTELAALALPGAPGDSYTNGHTGGYTGPGVPNGHRATVVARVSSSSRLRLAYAYQPDSYIPVSARFEIDLNADHSRNYVKVSVSPSSLFNPIYCSWKQDSYRLLSCSSSTMPLSYNTLYTVTVQEYNPTTLQWAVVTKAYFRTVLPVYTF
jgi:hypothetical protein